MSARVRCSFSLDQTNETIILTPPLPAKVGRTCWERQQQKSSKTVVSLLYERGDTEAEQIDKLQSNPDDDLELSQSNDDFLFRSPLHSQSYRPAASPSRHSHLSYGPKSEEKKQDSSKATAQGQRGLGSEWAQAESFCLRRTAAAACCRCLIFPSSPPPFLAARPWIPSSCFP